MSKDNTYILKGVAILMLLFLHLFCGQINELRPELPKELYQPLLYIGNFSIEYYITRCCWTFQIFFVLSGYGISYLHSQGRLTLKNRLKSLFFIFTAYWITLLIFVSIGYIMGYSAYPGSLWTLIANASSYSNSYNLSMWFLFPYSLICLTSPFLIKFIKTKNSYKFSLILTGLMYAIVSYIIKYHINEIGWQSFVSHILQYLQYLFPFTCGIVMEKTDIFKHPICQWLNYNQLFTAILLIVIMFIKCLYDSRIFDTFYALVFITLFIHIPMNEYVKRLLAFIGKYSMGIWMVHMFLSHYLFTEFIYGFRYPLLIFSVLVLCSITASIIITKINNYTRQRLSSNKYQM